MQRIALMLAVTALVACALPAPGHVIALGLAIGAIGTGWVGYRQRAARGALRLVAAGAMTVGGAALALAVIRVAIILVAIEHLRGLIG